MLKRSLPLILVALSVCLAAAFAAPAAKDYPYRLVYVHAARGLDDVSQVEVVRQIAETAGKHGFNGLVYGGAFDKITTEYTYAYKNLREMVDICRANGLEFIPALMGLGYNAPLLSHDKHLAEGLPVREALFVVKGGEANVVSEAPLKLVNGGFEQEQGGKPDGFTLTTRPGVTITLDQAQVKEGRRSLKVQLSAGAKDPQLDQREEDAEFDEGMALATQQLTVNPWRIYRVSCWVRTEGLEGGGDVFPLLVQTTDGRRRLQFFIPAVKPTSGGWVKAVIVFNSKEYRQVNLSLGLPSGDTGAFWIDGLTVQEEGLVNVIRREGTPLVVKGDANGAVYQEGKDFAPVYDPTMTLLYDHEPPSIKILPTGRIKDGERLRVSFYNTHPIYNGQTPACMSTPQIYEWGRKNVEFLHQFIQPKAYYVGVDELRMFASCEACRSQGKSYAELLGDYTRRQVETIRSIDPQAEILIWGDMFDPHHNAGDGFEAGADYMGTDFYYLMDGTFKDSWKYLPKDLIVINWYGEVRDKSLKHFSDLGFRTIGSASGGVEDARGWLESLAKNPGTAGVMFTFWSENYGVLGQIGDLITSFEK